MSNTADLDDLFFLRLDDIARELGANALNMASVMYSESGCKASAHNPNGHASGLIQFMPATLTGLGWTKGHETFRELTATSQLAFVRRYYLPYRGSLGSIAGLYVATFLPALLKHASEPDYVLTAKAGQLAWAYGPNAVFDANKDGQITVGELEDAVRRNARGPRWEEIRARIAAAAAPLPPADPDLPIVHAIPDTVTEE